MAEATSLLFSVERLRRNAGKTIAGYRRFRQVVEEDAALPATIKRLFLAAAACTKGYEDLALRELRAASVAGLGIEQAASSIAILSSSRGEGAALRFAEVFAAVYPEAAAGAFPEVAIDVAPGEAADNFLRYFGTMPPSLGKLIELVPLGADAYYLMREGTLSGTALESRFAELLLVTVLAADYSTLASVHMNGARRAGASEAEIAEAVICAVPVAGLSAWVVGAGAMDTDKA